MDCWEGLTKSYFLHFVESFFVFFPQRFYVHVLESRVGMLQKLIRFDGPIQKTFFPKDVTKYLILLLIGLMTTSLKLIFWKTVLSLDLQNATLLKNELFHRSLSKILTAVAQHLFQRTALGGCFWSSELQFLNLT